MKKLLAAFVILAIVLAILTIQAPAAQAVWNPAGERGEATFELIPSQGKIHAKKIVVSGPGGLTISIDAADIGFTQQAIFCPSNEEVLRRDGN